jgi:hypothetical protein
MMKDNEGCNIISDEETLAQSHQATHERLHGLLPHREEEDCGGQSRHSQRRDFQTAGKEVGQNPPVNLH